MASSRKIKVIIVGAGLGGCAAALAMKYHGHDVVVYEKVRRFRRLGDSLGIGENALKLLRRWGGRLLYERLLRIGNQADNLAIRRWHDGKVLAEQPLTDMAGRIGHRGDYHNVLLRAVTDAHIPVYMDHEAVTYAEDGEGARVIFADGSAADADIIVGADGIKSRARSLILGLADTPRSSGYACFRAYLSGDKLRQRLGRSLEFLDHDCLNVWIGADKHLVQNTLRNGHEVNWVLTRKIDSKKRELDMLLSESWFRPGDMKEVQQCVEGLDSRIAEAILASETCVDWIIGYRDPLSSWVSKKHRIALLGDSCHAHMPTSSQGTGQAVESAAVLAMCLDFAGKNNIPLATRTYEKLRFKRVCLSQDNGEDLRARWHNTLRDMDDSVDVSPEAVKIRNRWLYSFDAEADTATRWTVMSAQVAQELRTGTIKPLFS